MGITDRNLKTYYRSLKRRLPYVKGTKKEFLVNVQQSVRVFLEEEPDASMQDLYGQIGTVDELCEEYKDALEPEEYACAVRRNRRLGIAAGIAAVACAAMCVWCGYFVHELREEPPIIVHEYITDSTEMGD